MKSAIAEITDRIRERSAPARAAYLARIDKLAARPRGSDRMGCANVAHAFAALPADDKLKIVAERAPHLGIVTAYNDMLSAHQPYEGYPALIRDEARRHGATAQVAGGVPAMCDGVTQGLPGMELSLFSRDTIAMGTAIALTHDLFDGALLLGICDKIVPGLLIGALHFGHLPCVFVPAGPMSTGLSNNEKSKVRELHAEGKVGRDALLEAEGAAYHGPGTCTSTAPPTATRCCWRRWACTYPAPPSCIRMRPCASSSRAKRCARCWASRGAARASRRSGAWSTNA
jgi:phosphogluconate dehydratase